MNRMQVFSSGSKLARGMAYVLSSAVIFGFTPVLAAISYQGGNNGVNMAFLRAVLPLPLLLLLAARSGHGSRPSPDQIRKGICLGFLLFGCTLLLYSSYSYIPVGVATTLHFMYPIYVVVYKAVFHGQKMGRRRVCGLVLGVAGALLFLDTSGQGLDWRGLVFAVLSGICYAAYIVVLGIESKHPLSLYQLMLAVSVTGAVFCGGVGLATGRLVLEMTGIAWLCAAAVAFLVAVVSCVLFQAGVRMIGESNAAIFSLLEPITSIVFSYLLLNDRFSPAKLAGCVLILAGLLFTAVGTGAAEGVHCGRGSKERRT